MTIEQLKYFVSVAECQSFSIAASKINVTQPSLSLSISRLEAELGFALFDRTKHGTILTKEGKNILDKSIEVLDLLDELSGMAGEQSKNVQSNITLCTISTLSPVMAAVAQRLKEEFPDVHLQIVESGNRTPRDMVMSGTADIGLISKRYPIDDSCVFKQLIHDRMIVCVPRASYLAQLEVVRFSDLCECPLAMSMPEFKNNETGENNSIDMASQILVEFEKRGIEPRVFVSTRQSRLTRVLGAQTGCAYFQPTILNMSDPALLNGDYVSKEIECQIPCIYGILYQKSHKKTSVFKFTLELLKTEIKEAFELD